VSKEIMAALRKADKKLRAIAQYAKGNARAAKTADDSETWGYHAEEVERVAEALRELVGQPREQT